MFNSLQLKLTRNRTKFSDEKDFPDPSVKAIKKNSSVKGS